MCARLLHHLYPLLSFFRFVSCTFSVISPLQLCSFLLSVVGVILFSVLVLSLDIVCLSIYPLISFYPFFFTLFFPLHLFFPSFYLSGSFLSNQSLFPLCLLSPSLAQVRTSTRSLCRTTKFYSLDALLTTKLYGSAVNVQLVELDHYRYGDVWMTVNHIAGPTFPLPHIPRRHVKNLVASMRELGSG